MDFSRQKEDNVVDMTSFQPDTGFSALSQVEGYWNSLRGTRLMPRRADIDPRGIESALEYTFILERIAPGMARLRIAGSHMSDLMGMEVRGMPLSSFIAPDGRRQISDTLEEVFQRPAIAEIRLTAQASFDKPAMDARLLLLPLKSDLGDVSRVLGCMVARGTIGRCPRRFEIASVQIRPITAAAGSAPQAVEAEVEAQETAVAKSSGQEQTPQAPATPATGMAETAKTFEGKKRSAADVPYLRLIDDND